MGRVLEDSRPAIKPANDKSLLGSIPELPQPRLILATGGTMLALMLAALDQTVVGTALPHIVSELKGLNYYPWVITAYLVCSTSMTPVAGKLGDLFGRKPLLLVGMSGFMAASALCGLSADMLQLILFRAVQGLFAGFLFGTVFSVVGDLYPPERRGKIQGLFGSVWAIAAIVGPPVGGVLTDSLGWRWVFYVNVPVGLIAVLLVAIALPFARSRASWREIDFWGAAGLVGFLAPLLVALSIARDHAWTSPLVSGLLVAAAVMLVVFLMIEARAKAPIVPLELFRNPTFSAAVAISFFSAFGMFATIIYGPLVFQGVLGVSATNSGALTAPMSLGQIAAAVTTGTLMVRVRRYRFFGTLGAAAMIVGMWLMSQVTVTSSQLEVTRNVVIIGLGLGATFPLTMNSVQNAVPRQLIGVVSSQVQFFRAVGGTVAVAVLGTVLTQRLQPNIDSEIRGLRLPANTASLLTGQGGGNPQTLFDPSNIARARASLPPGTSQLFDSVLEATRIGLAHTLHDLFLTGGVIVVMALVASLFLREVPIRAAKTTRPAAATAGAAELPAAQPAAEPGQAGAPVPSSTGEVAASADEALERIGSRYLADLVQALAVEVERRFEMQLMAKDEQITQLNERAEAAEHQREELEERIHGLEKELEGRARELDEELMRHHGDLRSLGESLTELAVAAEQRKARVGKLGEESTQPADRGAESEQDTVVWDEQALEKDRSGKRPG